MAHYRNRTLSVRASHTMRATGRDVRFPLESRILLCFQVLIYVVPAVVPSSSHSSIHSASPPPIITVRPTHRLCGTEGSIHRLVWEAQLHTPSLLAPLTASSSFGGKHPNQLGGLDVSLTADERAECPDGLGHATATVRLLSLSDDRRWRMREEGGGRGDEGRGLVVRCITDVYCLLLKRSNH